MHQLYSGTLRYPKASPRCNGQRRRRRRCRVLGAREAAEVARAHGCMYTISLAWPILASHSKAAHLVRKREPAGESDTETEQPSRHQPQDLSIVEDHQEVKVFQLILAELIGMLAC